MEFVEYASQNNIYSPRQILYIYVSPSDPNLCRFL